MDGFFDLDDQPETKSGTFVPVDTGVLESLQDSLSEGQEALQVMQYSNFMYMTAYEEKFEEFHNELLSIHQEFSSADIEVGAKDSLQGLIDSLGNTYNKLYEESYSHLEHAHAMLEDWQGEAANNAKFYLESLKKEYDTVAGRISQLQADVVAAREVVAKSRSDLANLTGTLKDAADQYKEKEEAASRGASDVLGSGFAGAVAGLLVVGTTIATGGTAAISMVAAGAVIAGHAAGSMAVDEVKQTKVTGEDPFEIFADYKGGVDDLRKGINDALQKLINDIGALEMPKLADPPDVSPGKSFDPGKFGTEDMPKDTEKGVRDSGKDIPNKKDLDEAEDHVAEPIRN